MKPMFTAAAVILFACSSLLAAQAKPQPQAAKQGDSKTWFESTLKSVKTRVSGKFHSSGMRTGAVAAVRGSKMGEDANKPYWKGGISEKAAKKLESEKAEFAAGLELAVAGKNDEAYQSFQKFLADNPGSVLTADVKEAMSKLTPPAGTEISTAAAAAQQPAPAETPNK